VTTVVTGSQPSLPSTNPFDETTPLLSNDDTYSQHSARVDNYGGSVDMYNPAADEGNN